MTNKHWIGMAVVILAAYFVGVYYPAFGKTAISKAQSVVS
jgi:hypothetical protein